MMTTRGARALRGTLASFVAVFVAALFHAASGGAAPSAVAVSLALAFSAPVCVALAGRRLSLWRMTASVVLSQAVFHLLFGLGSTSARLAPVMPGTGHVHGGSMTVIPDAAAGAATATGMPSMPVGGVLLGSDPLMWLGHATAALVTIAALTRGEATLRRIAALAIVRIRSIARVEPVAVHEPLPVFSVWPRSIALPEPRLILGGMRHRGPPALPAPAL